MELCAVWRGPTPEPWAVVSAWRCAVPHTGAVPAVPVPCRAPRVPLLGLFPQFHTL